MRSVALLKSSEELVSHQLYFVLACVGDGLDPLHSYTDPYCLLKNKKVSRLCFFPFFVAVCQSFALLENAVVKAGVVSL